MIQIFTDFGLDGPYVGQLRGALARAEPGVPIIDLMHDAPTQNPRLAAYLLAALADEMAEGCVCLAVVDPGVGGARSPVIVSAGGRCFVGPDNGLFEIVQRRVTRANAWTIDWRPEKLSASFHGRDLFAPVAAMLAAGSAPDDLFAPDPMEGLPGADWPDDLPEILYADGFGNLMTGLRAASIAESTSLRAGGKTIPRARVFGEATPDTPFWYANSCGLIEIAVPSGSAAAALGLVVGDTIELG